MKKLKLFFACLLMAVLSIGQVWAAEDEVHKFNSSNETREVGLNNNAAIPAIEIAAPAYPVKKVAVNCKYNKSGLPGVTISVTVGGEAFGDSYTFNTKETKTINFTGASAASGDIVISFVNNSGTGTGKGTFYVYYVELTEGASGGTPTCAAPTFSPNGATFYGESQTVELACATSDATIHYTLDGSTPTSSSATYSEALSLTATTTIKAIAVKEGANDSEISSATFTKGEAVTSYAINFETNNLDAYVNWDFVNIGIKSTTITAHGGTYYGANINGDGNGVATASITTKAKYANPGTLTFYISKESGNTTASSWKAQVSEDGEAWTDVETFDAKGMGKGEWNECTADLSSYSNVYVRISYGSSNAIRAIDDIELAAASATPKAAKPTFETGDDFVTSTSVTLACATEGASIYYTTNGDEPTSGSTLYNGEIPVSTTTTIKAIAVADGYDNSPVAEKTFTKVEALESLAALLEATTSTETAFNVVISDWVVTGAISNRAWISNAENTKGILLYKSGHGFTAGKKLNGVVIGTKAKLYQGYPELTTLLASEVTVSDAAEITPRTTTLADLVSGYNVEQGTLVKLENVTYTAGTGFSDGSNTVALSTQLYGPTMVDGATYNIIGVVRYDNGPVYSIMPRSVDDVEQTGGGGLPEVDGLAALKAETTGASYLVNLTDAVVTLVSGNNAFIEDATAGALIFYSGHGLVAGDKLNGQYEVTTATYQGKFEITAMEAQTGAEKTSGAEIPVTTLTIAQLNANFAANESKRIKIVGANVTDAISGSDRNGAISDGAALAVYAGVASTITLNENDNVDIIGYPGFHNTDEQLTVWAQADITVNVKEDPELAYNPAVVNVLLSDLASFTPADLEYATGFDGLAAITYESSDPSIATVETDGTVTLVATAEGSATITASFPGNATYKVDNASYTINVSATPITPVYTMSFDMTRASYDAAADAQVVWNSNVVTMTADKNDGTKVTNYLAGNYSGTTLIEETRFYTKNSISFVPQSGVTITKIEWMSTAKGYATKLAAETFVNATAVVDGTDDKLVIITPSAAGEISVTLTDAARATGVTVYYEAESEKAKLAASIAIANINTAVGAEDILLSDVAATSNPNKKAISYAVTSGSEYVSITGEGPAAAFHALAEGTATITATIPNDLGNYTGATTTFNIVVAAAPPTLVSIAISGDAEILEYTEGQDFNPAGLVVTGTYSDASTAPITEGITWAFDPSPLTQETTSVSVTATVSEITSEEVVVNGLTVSAAPTPVAENVVILATYGTKLYAMSTTLSSSAFTAIEVEEDGSNIVVPNADAKAAIQWTRTTTGENTTFQNADSKYMAGGTGNTNMSLADDSFNWSWNATDSYYYIGTTRSFFYYKSGVFKNYSINNAGGDDYSGFAEVRAIDPANIVVSSKVDPELAYTPASDEITVGDAWSAPALGYVEGFDGLAAISYESSNEAVATVSDAGVIALAGGTGTATITATFGGNASYLAGSATYTITVNAPAPTPTGTTYTKVTSTGEITDGEYLIVYEEESVAFNGDLTTLDAANNTVSVVISGDEIAGTTAIDAAVFTIDVANGTLRAHMGDYIGVTSYGNGLKQNANAETYPAHSFSIDGDGNAVISLNNSWTAAMILNYNKGVSDKRFRYYKSASPQQSIQLYKKETPEPPTPVYETVRTGLVEGRHYTVCLENNVTAVKGATFWSLTFKNNEGTVAYLVKEEAPFAAGTPYIFQATGDNEGKLEVVYGEEIAGSAGTNGALVGTFSYLDADALNTINETGENDVYMLFNNELRPIGTNNHLDAHRAYVLYNLLTPASPSSFAPGKTVKGMPMHRDAAQGFENLQSGDAPVKVMIEGTLYILRGENVYDATGRLVK